MTVNDTIETLKNRSMVKHQQRNKLRLDNLKRKFQNAALINKRECSIESDQNNLQPIRAFRPQGEIPVDDSRVEGQITVSRLGVIEDFKEIQDLDSFIERTEKTHIIVKQQPLEYPNKAMVSEVSLLTHERDNSQRATKEKIVKYEKEGIGIVQSSERQLPVNIITHNIEEQ